MNKKLYVGNLSYEMDTEEAAQEAIDRLNNYELNQRTITVSEARPPRERSSGGGGGRGRSSRGGGRRDYY